MRTYNSAESVGSGFKTVSVKVSLGERNSGNEEGACYILCCKVTGGLTSSFKEVRVFEVHLCWHAR